MGIIAQIMRQPGERIAVQSGESAISFARLMADVDAAATTFRQEGIDSGTTVGIRAGAAENGHSYANWVAHLAVLKLGAAHVSLTDAPSIRASLHAGRVDRVIGTFEALIDVPKSVARTQFHVDPAGPAEVVEPVANDEASAVRLNLTSGTTGKPKFVAWDAEMIERRVEQIVDQAVINAETRLFPLLHLRTTAGFRYPLAVWAAGGRVHLPQARKGLDRDREAMPKSNFVITSPPQLKERLNGISGLWPGREERTIAVLGGRLPASLRDAAVERACARLLISYGATETGSIAVGDHEVINRHPGAVGFVRPGVEVEIVNAEGNRLAAGEPGLVRTRTPIMAASHESVSEPAGGLFRDGWFYPGDLGRLFDDGLLAIEGRAGDALNLGGWKVSATDLEARVAEMPGVADACAVAVQLPEGDRLVFGVVCDDNCDLKALQQTIHKMLARRRPFHVIRVKSIPRNAMGKIPRVQIASQLAAVYRSAKKNAANA